MRKIALITTLIVLISFTVYAEDVIPIITNDATGISSAQNKEEEVIPIIENNDTAPIITSVENASPVAAGKFVSADLENIQKTDDNDLCIFNNLKISQSNMFGIIKEYIKYENVYENGMNYLKVHCVPKVYLHDGREVSATIPATAPILNDEDAFTLVKNYFSLTSWQGKYDVYYNKYSVRIKCVE